MDHVRIDEGVKRGPKRTFQHRAITPVADIGSYAIPSGLNHETVLQEYLVAQKTSQVAVKYGIARKALTRWLREKDPDGWKRVQIIRALARKEDSDDGLEDARDALSLARAREMLRSAQWDLERLDYQTFGEHKFAEVTVSTADFDARLRRAMARVDQERAVQLPQCTTAHNDDAQSQVIDAQVVSERTSYNVQNVK